MDSLNKCSVVDWLHSVGWEREVKIVYSYQWSSYSPLHHPGKQGHGDCSAHVNVRDINLSAQQKELLLQKATEIVPQHQNFEEE